MTHSSLIQTVYVLDWITPRQIIIQSLYSKIDIFSIFNIYVFFVYVVGGLVFQWGLFLSCRLLGRGKCTSLLSSSSTCHCGTACILLKR